MIRSKNYLRFDANKILIKISFCCSFSYGPLGWMFPLSKSSERDIFSQNWSSRSQKFFEIGVFKNFAIFAGKQLLESLFNTGSGLKRDSNTAVFMWTLRSFYEQRFYRTPPVVASREKKQLWLYWVGWEVFWLKRGVVFEMVEIKEIRSCLRFGW